MRIVVTCEHGGNDVPAEYRDLFRGREKLLAGHRGYDAGARELAAVLAKGLGAHLYSSAVTRLLVDLNRSRGNPELFSDISRTLNQNEKVSILENYYLPYRERVVSEIARSVRQGRRVLHLSVHTFTPVLRGKVRNADIGLLYDPAREGERRMCAALQKAVFALAPSVAVRRNYPYRGTSDGFTTSLRKEFSGRQYLGIEIEVSQKWYPGTSRKWRTLLRIIPKAVITVLATVSSPSFTGDLPGIYGRSEAKS